MYMTTPKKYAALEKMSDKNGVIAALAIDQRGSLKKMLAAAANKPANEEDIVEFKKAISKELTPYASAILLDPEYGLPASKVRAEGSGLLVSYEKTGYDATEPGRLPDLISVWSVRRLKEAGADSIKFLLYIDPDEDKSIIDQKEAFVERVGDECVAEDIPFFVELVTYDDSIGDVKSAEYAKVKPHKVIEAMKEFSKPQYHIDVLKVEVPINLDYVEGFNGDNPVVYTKDEAIKYFKEQSDATNLPYIFLSAGVSAQAFRDELHLAKDAGAKFNGVLCGRATWRGAIEPFAKDGEEAGKKWMNDQGKKNIEELNEVLAETATSWKDKVSKD
ncbi:tagatose-bisphosphate aldolase [Companilactobacillus zhachilii]|uniref:Tagatose 1,6-diphosphate aldolase n=2 Tax=Companilactobacillus zhachilii TaxID=2304606 RepID=A0A386PTI5_9LACO|nr:tagatose-bisphosphate aldolase [Companilactobacillus zhachilii]AYE39334.1 tagatose-bisphosphate aldolase [Companilactobacillus zhachilii]MBL3531625.1 tagatose-bisphosphate aldolase [Companilactobacillus zhachilii]